MKNIRTRYAPSPTGYLHIGGARTALFCYLFAKANSGSFIVRIEDTDLNRNISNSGLSQLSDLRWLGIKIDETVDCENSQYRPYRQSQRIEIYQKYLEKLIESGNAYKCYDTIEEIEEQKQQQIQRNQHSFRFDRNWLKISEEEKAFRESKKAFSYRLKLDSKSVFKWNDLVRQNIEIKASEISEFVIWKSDGMPTYNFCNVIDDHLMDISHVFRGEEHISNTAKQLALYQIFDWKPPQFAHLTIITNSAGKKLSKRDLDITQYISGYRDQGFLAPAIFNFLALLGWTSPDAQEIMSFEELIKVFSWERFSKSSTKFDLEKLKWMSNKYFQKLSLKDLREICLPFLDKKLLKNDQKWLDLLLLTYQPQIYSGKHLYELTLPFVNPIKKLNAIQIDFLRQDFAKRVVQVFYQEIKNQNFSVSGIQEAINAVKEITKFKGRQLFLPIRYGATLQEHGPELAKAIFLSGEALVNQNLNYVLDLLNIKE